MEHAGKMDAVVPKVVNTEEDPTVPRKNTGPDVALIASVQVVILCDCTGSMGAWIEASKEMALVTAEKIRASFKGCDFQLAFVGYRDYDDVPRFEVHDFTRDIVALRASIMPIVARGGGDAAEDVAGGLDKVLGLKWEADERILIFVADAPGHGRTFHPASYSDAHPGGDKYGLDPLAQVRTLASQGVDMTVLKASADLNTMVDLMAVAHAEGAKRRRDGGEGANFVVLDVIAQGAASAVHGSAPRAPLPESPRLDRPGGAMAYRGLAASPAAGGLPRPAHAAASSPAAAAAAYPAAPAAYSYSSGPTGSGYTHYSGGGDPALSSAASVAMSSAVMDSVTRSMVRRAAGGGSRSTSSAAATAGSVAEAAPVFVRAPAPATAVAAALPPLAHAASSAGIATATAAVSAMAITATAS